MPHQCLKCGKVFEEGSTHLLKGCPVCNGNRFFYTKEPLDEIQRQKIIKQVGKDINSVIMKLMNLENKERIVDEPKINLGNIKKEVEKEIIDKKVHEKEVGKYTLSKQRGKGVIGKIKESNSPETIEIEKTGIYRIDLKGLLEKEPIVIEKDGSYTIHLASVFKMIDKEKKD